MVIMHINNNVSHGLKNYIFMYVPKIVSWRYTLFTTAMETKYSFDTEFTTNICTYLHELLDDRQLIGYQSDNTSVGRWTSLTLK